MGRHNGRVWHRPPNILNVAFIPDDAELDRQPLALLQAEIARIEKLVSTDRDTANKFTVLSKRITEETIAYERLREKLVDCEGARLRVQVLVGEREASYKRVFDAIVAREGVLREASQFLDGST